MSNGRCRVLVVDDDPDIREVISLILSEEGFRIRGAENGRQALAVLQDWRADLILLDLMMPVMDGAAFRTEQRRTAAIADIPVVVLTASRPVGGSSTEGLGCAALLSKPCDLGVLVETVTRVAGARAGEP